jgi:hypothetical protein
MPTIAKAPKLKPLPRKTAVMIASGDLRESANVACWPAQQELEAQVTSALKSLGWKVVRMGASEHPTKPELSHGFISSQHKGREVFEQIHPDAPLIVAEAVWQYSHHVLMGLTRHRGPILLLANWSGQWPGLVGVLNLRGSLTKAGVEYSILWTEDFNDPEFLAKLKQWTDGKKIKHDTSHARSLKADALPTKERRLGESLAAELQHRPAIMGVFDEGCMGMYNAIIPDHLLHAAGVYKERLSQSALYHAMTQVPNELAIGCRKWLDARGMKFQTGPNPATDLTDEQVLQQCKMYIAACRIADEFSCDAIGIQYQQGLKDLCPASDLAEGLLNCSDRPPVRSMYGPHATEIIRDGRPIPHFNEVDECAGLDAIITDRVWRAMGLQPDNTLHDLRWGDVCNAAGGAEGGEYVWVFEISGAVPPSHFADGYAGAVSERQPEMYFRLGGGTIKGVSKPGEVVWSRVYVGGARSRKNGGKLRMDIGRCKAIALPAAETERRWKSTTSQWPIMHAVLYGVSRDQMMAKHQANHIQVVYAPDAATADNALAAKAAMAAAMGIRVNLCGTDAKGRRLFAGKR